MNTFEPIDKDRLRHVDLMIAYLTDTASLEDIIKIEALMKEDDLYRLAMEELAREVSKNPQVAREKVVQTEALIDNMLLSGKNAFLAQTFAAEEENDITARFRKTPFIYRFFGILAGLVVATLLIWLPLRKPSLPLDPSANLIIGDDLQMATAFIGKCDNKGFGRPEGQIEASVSVSSALVDNYAEGNYPEAAAQFSQLLKNPSFSDSCLALIHFYQAKSLMAAGETEAAVNAFSQTIEQIAATPALVNASHWYLGNLLAVNEDYIAARVHFEKLAVLDPSAKKNHLPSLLAKNYLTEARQFLEYMR
ncbi:MAG: tetratricopeptide repeat protein [Bacteroidia bacterium]|nr:tetratricopeptide repeat protein [Bacteroidia bacterium]